jgi:hypothetical protein
MYEMYLTTHSYYYVEKFVVVHIILDIAALSKS